MPLSCSHCGAQNADDMRFCQSCGSPLTPTSSAPEQASPPEGPTPRPAPAPAVPPARGAIYQPAPSHRLPLGSLVGIMVGVLGILAAIGILTSHRGPVPPPVVPSPTIVPAQPTQVPPQPTSPPQQPTQPAQPTSAPAQPTQPAQPTSPPQPTQPAQPTSAPTQPSGPTGPGQTVSTTTFSVFVPSEWQVIKQTTNPSQNEVVLQDPSTAPNGLDIFSGVSTSATNAQSVLQSVLTNAQQKYPDAQQCGNTVQSTFGGIAGTLMPICFTITPQGGTAISVAELAWAATDPAGSTVYFVAQTAAQTNQTFFTHAGDVTKTIKWGGGQ